MNPGSSSVNPLVTSGDQEPLVIQTPRPALNKQLIRQRFDKASRSYQAHHRVQQRIAKALIDIMREQVTTASKMLDLGCGPGPDWRELKRLCQHYIGIDLSGTMLSEHQAHASGDSVQLIQADMENLPLRTASVDTLYSGMAMQWAGCRTRLCGELTRVLKPGASAFFSVPLDGSLEPLGQLRRSIDAQPQVNPQPRLQDWVSAWETAGCVIQRAEQVCFTEHFANLKQLLQSIKGVGAGASQALPLTRKTLHQLASDYEVTRTTDGLPLHYQVGLFHVTTGLK